MSRMKGTVASHSEPKTADASGFLRKERRWTPEMEAAERDASIVLFDLTRVPVYPPGGPPAGRVNALGRAVTTRGVLQAKLEVGSVDDPLEQEADQVADKVLRMPDPTAAGGAPEEPPGLPVTAAGARLSRKCAGCKQEEDKEKGVQVQRRAAPGAAAGLAEAPPIVEQTLGGGGRPLDEGARAYFEPRFGFDLSKVRIHADARAAESARAVSAHAYTVGRDIVFGQGRYAPGEREGRRLLAHELAHVAQQSSAARPSGRPVAVSSVPPRVARDAASDVDPVHEKMLNALIAAAKGDAAKRAAAVAVFTNITADQATKTANRLNRYKDDFTQYFWHSVNDGLRQELIKVVVDKVGPNGPVPTPPPTNAAPKAAAPAGQASPGQAPAQAPPAPAASSDFEEGKLVVAKQLINWLSDLGGEPGAVALPPVAEKALLKLGKPHPKGAGKAFFATLMKNPTEPAEGRPGIVRTDWVEPADIKPAAAGQPDPHNSLKDLVKAADYAGAFRQLAHLNDGELTSALKALHDDAWLSSKLGIHFDQAVNELDQQAWKRILYALDAVEFSQKDLYVDNFNGFQIDPSSFGTPDPERVKQGKWNIKLVLSYPLTPERSLMVFADDISDDEPQGEELAKQSKTRVGDGGILLPAQLNKGTAPKLWAAKKKAIAMIEEGNYTFVLVAHTGAEAGMTVASLGMAWINLGTSNPAMLGLPPEPQPRRGIAAQPPAKQGAGAPGEQEPAGAPLKQGAAPGEQAKGATAPQPGAAPGEQTPAPAQQPPRQAPPEEVANASAAGRPAAGAQDRIVGENFRSGEIHPSTEHPGNLEMDLLATANDETVKWGKAYIGVDSTGKPNPLEPPELDLDNRVIVGGRQVKLSVPANSEGFTDRALRMLREVHVKRFGVEPENLGGSLERENLLNFQREYAKLIEGKATPQEAGVGAIKEISFGKARIRQGFSDFTVETSKFEPVDLGADGRGNQLGVRQVPTEVKIAARRPPPGGVDK